MIGQQKTQQLHGYHGLVVPTLHPARETNAKSRKSEKRSPKPLFIWPLREGGVLCEQLVWLHVKCMLPDVYLYLSCIAFLDPALMADHTKCVRVPEVSVKLILGSHWGEVSD